MIRLVVEQMSSTGRCVGEGVLVNLEASYSLHSRRHLGRRLVVVGLLVLYSRPITRRRVYSIQLLPLARPGPHASCKLFGLSRQVEPGRYSTAGGQVLFAYPAYPQLGRYWDLEYTYPPIQEMTVLEDDRSDYSQLVLIMCTSRY